MQDRIIDIPANEQATQRKLRPFQATVGRNKTVRFLTQAKDLAADGSDVGEFNRADGQYDFSVAIDMDNADNQAGMAWLQSKFNEGVAVQAWNTATED